MLNDNLKKISDAIKAVIQPILDKRVEAKTARYMQTYAEYLRKDSEACDLFNSRKVTLQQSIQNHRDLTAWIFTQVTKTDWNRLKGCKETDVKAYYQKEAKQTLLKIDYAIEKKIADEIIQIVDGECHQGLDGYWEGNWRLLTANNENKAFGFRAITAGGYNIQCFHIRTIYKYKPAK